MVISVQIEKGVLETSVFFVLDCSFKLKFDKIEDEKNQKGSIMSKGLLISIEGPDGAERPQFWRRFYLVLEKPTQPKS